MMEIKEKLPRLLRYGAVSVICTSVSLSVLTALVATRTLPAGWANVVATACGTFPSFELNRRWVWGRSGRRSMLAEVGPFWAITFAGLLLSTLAVSLAAGLADRSGYSSDARTLIVAVANLTAWGSLWLLQFFILDRVLFADKSQPAPTSSTPDSELHGSVWPL